MELATNDLYLLFLFTIPGFFVVKTFTSVMGRKIESDFEYLMFSMFWGVILMAFMGAILDSEILTDIFSNPLVGMFLLSSTAVLFSYLTAHGILLNHPEKTSSFYNFVTKILTFFWKRIKKR